MIFISVVLVAVALALLLSGLFAGGVVLIYLSIAASVVAALLLALGVRADRGVAATESAAPAPDLVDRSPAAATTAQLPAVGGDESAASAGSVMVVSGRPRYHRAGCRFLTGRADAEEIPVEEARELGFTPCGVCRPDESLTAAAAGSANTDGPEPAGEPAVAEPVAEPVAGPVAKTQRPVAVRRSSRPVDAPGRRAPARGAASAAGRAKATQPPARAARPMVVVIPDRDRFHRGECRFVRGVRGTETLTKAAATRQGYLSCGVCKP